MLLPPFGFCCELAAMHLFPSPSIPHSLPLTTPPCLLCLQAVPLVRSWLPAASGWVARAGQILWSSTIMTAGATICKYVTQMIEQHGCGGFVNGHGWMNLGSCAELAQLAMRRYIFAGSWRVLSMCR